MNLQRIKPLARHAMLRGLTLLAALAPLSGCQSAPPSPYRWTEFVTTRGHANPIPKQWVATPAGRFVHDLVIPNPVPADSGYKPGMSADDYFRLLCEKEAGDFIFRKVEDVEGVYFARPPTHFVTDQELMDRWRLEHPYLESQFQLADTLTDRAGRFVSPPARKYRFYEEPNQDPKAGQPYWRLSGHKWFSRDKDFNVIPGTPWKQEEVSQLKSKYGLIWRGIHRPFDRENGIAGGELIAYDLLTNEVLAVFRNFAYTGRMKNTPDGAWWLSAGGCRRLDQMDQLDSGLRSRPPQVLKPIE